MKQLIAMLSLTLGLLLSGCASTTTPAVSATPAKAAETEVSLSIKEPPCPPDTDNRPLERDLTVPFSQRTYLLDSGALCTPGTYPALPVGWVTEPVKSESAEPTRQGSSP
jgi:hypothetical protein